MNKQKSPGPAATGTRATTEKRHLNSNSLAAQRQRLLEALKAGPLSTLDARALHDILHPAGRIMELRRQGWPIDLVWIEQPTECGKLHRVGKYLLVVRGQ